MKKILDPKNLPYFGALVQAVLFALAGNEFFPVLGWLVGLGVGAVVNYSLAIASSRFSDIAEKRKPLARLSLVFMFLLSPLTITLSFFAPTSIFTTIAWSMCVDASIILAGSIVGKSLIPFQEVAKGRSATAEVAGSVAKGRSAKSKRSPATVVADIWRCECGAEFTNRYKYSGHAGKCAVHKTGKLIPVGLKSVSLDNSRNTPEVSSTPRST